MNTDCDPRMIWFNPSRDGDVRGLFCACRMVGRTGLLCPVRVSELVAPFLWGESTTRVGRCPEAFHIRCDFGLRILSP